MNKKGISRMILLIIIVAIVIFSSLAIYLAMSGGDGSTDGTTDNGGTNGNGTPDNGSTEVSVEGASSLQFKVNVSPADSESVEYTYMIKNAESSDVMMRIEMESASEEFIYIINGAQENVWVYSNGEWMDFSNLYPTYWETWNSAWEGYKTNLLDWTGYGDWSYTTPNGDSVRIYEIAINPTLSDSLFQH